MNTRLCSLPISQQPHFATHYWINAKEKEGRKGLDRIGKLDIEHPDDTTTQLKLWLNTRKISEVENDSFEMKLRQLDDGYQDQHKMLNMYQCWSLLALYHHDYHRCNDDIDEIVIKSTINENPLLSSCPGIIDFGLTTVKTTHCTEGRHEEGRHEEGDLCFDEVIINPDSSISFSDLDKECQIFSTDDAGIDLNENGGKGFYPDIGLSENTTMKFVNAGRTNAQITPDESSSKGILFGCRHERLLSNGWSKGFSQSDGPCFDVKNSLEICPPSVLLEPGCALPVYRQRLKVDKDLREIIQQDALCHNEQDNKQIKYHINDQSVIDRVTFNFAEGEVVFYSE